MGEVVNLNQARKRKARDAAANRVKHGRTATEKANDRRAEARRLAQIEDKRRDDEPPH
jgi:hypothetical protein